MSNSSDLKVGIVDDSALIRQIIQKVVEETPGMRVVGSSEDPFEAREMIKAQNPDVITLDVEMPKMNGIEFLDKIMRLRPMPVIMVSTLTQKGADITLQALELGAVDYVAKPDHGSRSDDILDVFRKQLVPKLQIVKQSNFKGKTLGTRAVQTTAPSQRQAPFDLIGIASSTGGIERLRYLFSHISINIPPVMIVQHINKMYAHSMVERMQKIVPPHISVKCAEHKEPIKPNTIYFANNQAHLEVKQVGSMLRAHLHNNPPLNGFIASADYLFNSMAETNGLRLCGIILSGMGNDGSKGLLNLKGKALTIGESRDSCLVYGMSRAAAELGAVEKELSVQKITNLLNQPE